MPPRGSIGKTSPTKDTLALTILVTNKMPNNLKSAHNMPSKYDPAYKSFPCPQIQYIAPFQVEAESLWKKALHGFHSFLIPCHIALLLFEPD